MKYAMLVLAALVLAGCGTTRAISVTAYEPTYYPSTYRPTYRPAYRPPVVVVAPGRRLGHYRGRRW